MDKKSKLKQLLLLKSEYKIMLEQGDKEGARMCLDRIAVVYNEITGKNLWNHFSNKEKSHLRESLDYDIEADDISQLEILDTTQDDVIR